MPVPTEAEVLRSVVKAFATLGVRVERQNTGVGFYPNADGSLRRVRYGRPGNLDLCGTIPTDGRRLEVEVKRPGKRPTPAQLERIRAINGDKGVAFWIDDASQVLRIMPLILAGGWIEEDDGEFYATDGRDA